MVLKNDKLKVYQKAKNEWLAGQYELPTFILSTTDKSLKQYPYLNRYTLSQESFNFLTTITKYKIKNSVVVVSEKEFKQFNLLRETEWRSITAEDSNFTTATLKVMSKFKKGKK
jgi:hypothetical protein